MNPHLVLVVLLLSSCLLHADPAITDLRDRALAAEAELRSDDALSLFLELERLQPDDAFILQKIAQQYSDSVVDLNDPAEIRRRATVALEYAGRAVALEPNNPVNVLSLAVARGKVATYSDTRTKVEYSRLIRNDAERALALDPGYAWAHHVLGRWHREVANLGTVARWVVRLVYGGLPDARIQDSITHLQRAVELEPEVLAHHVELGLAYRAAGMTEPARRHLEIGLNLPAGAKHDKLAQALARSALAELPPPTPS